MRTCSVKPKASTPVERGIDVLVEQVRRNAGEAFGWVLSHGRPPEISVGYLTTRADRLSSASERSRRAVRSWAYGADQIGVRGKGDIERAIRDPIRSTGAQIGDCPALRL